MEFREFRSDLTQNKGKGATININTAVLLLLLLLLYVLWVNPFRTAVPFGDKTT